MTEDHAALILRFIRASSNRYSPDRDDPVLGPIIEQSGQRYEDLRGHGFELANRIAMTEAIRSILALPKSDDDDSSA